MDTPSFRDRIDQRLFDVIYSRNLVYNACWEDPAVDRQALRLGPEDSVLVITSAGCNALIRDNKAILLTGTQQLLEIMGWDEQRKPVPKYQKELFVELSPEEKIIIDIIREKDAVHIDEINLKCQLSTSVIASVILNLELQNLVSSLPGKRYSLQ